jgi:peptide-N4-(N-acetyl-beta-glucosaminyl)asparagine amidase
MELNREQKELIKTMVRSLAMNTQTAKQYRNPRVLRILSEEVPSHVYMDNDGNRRNDMDILKESAKWFKEDYGMKWVGEPVICSKDGKEMKVEKEILNDWRIRGLEHNYCECGNTFEFPRYGDPLELMKTKQGLCGEWSHLYTGFLNSIDIKAGFTHDFTDHTWTEALVDGKWVHVDSTVNKVDSPMIYEEEWNKELNYIFAFYPDGTVKDVTKNYTKRWPEVKARRIVDPIPEYLISFANLKAKYTIL